VKYTRNIVLSSANIFLSGERAAAAVKSGRRAARAIGGASNP
jgi:hypothetical protein